MDFPKLETVASPNGRMYKTPSGKLYPSVTTVLGKFYEYKMKELEEKIGKEKLEAAGKRAAIRGSKIHEMCESYLKGTIDFTKENPAYLSLFSPIKKFLDANIKIPIAMEETVYSDKLKMAGRFDLLAKLKNDELCLIDYKTSTWHKEREHIDSYFFQATAYCTALREIMNIRVNKFCIIITEESSSVINPFWGDPNKYISELVKIRRSVPL